MVYLLLIIYITWMKRIFLWFSSFGVFIHAIIHNITNNKIASTNRWNNNQIKSDLNEKNIFMIIRHNTYFWGGSKFSVVYTVFRWFLPALEFTTPLNFTLKIWVFYLVNLEINPNLKLMYLVLPAGKYHRNTVMDLSTF